MVMRGESVRWQAVLIEVYILGILAMSYNLLFGFTGVVSFGHALFFGMGSYILGLSLEYTSLDTGSALIFGILAGFVVCALLGVLIGLVSLRLRGVYFAIFTLAVAEMFFIFFGRFQPFTIFCSTRDSARVPAGTSFVTVVPAPTVASLPTLTGAINCVSEPMETLLPMTVLCLLAPS